MTPTLLLKTNLARNGFDTPTAIQAASIEPALAGKNLVATAQTGTGKTLAFVLPMIHTLTATRVQAGIRVLILSPTRELAIQTTRPSINGRGHGLRALPSWSAGSARCAIASHPQRRPGGDCHPRPSV